MLLGGKHGFMAFRGADSVISYEWYLQLTFLKTFQSGTMSLWTWFLDQRAASTALRWASAAARHVFAAELGRGNVASSNLLSSVLL